MGSSWALVCFTAFVLVLLSSASTDEHDMEQREVTFDLDKIMQEMQQPDSFVLQKEVDLTDLFNPRDPPSFMPRSFGGPPILDYRVQFPLARPTSNNLQGICLNGDLRPRYPDSYFPDSGFGQQRRRASAVNNAESWFSTCCKGNQTWGSEATLCCATQAWELFVKSFCEEDSSVKDRLYTCCRLTSSDRLNCFNNDAQNPNYDATEELPVQPLPSAINFSFDPNTCQRTVMTPYIVRETRKKKKKVKPSASQKVDISFPPGQPTADNIKALCRDQKLRPFYRLNCLPKSGYELLARQAKTINRVEKGFRKCCKRKKNVLNCADHKWRKELDKFCVDEKGEQVDFHCCVGEKYSCFQNISPDPHYNITASELSLSNICDTYMIIKKKFPISLPLLPFVSKCCPLSEADRNPCMMQTIEKMLERCSSTNSHPTVRFCCVKSSQTASECISGILMDAITKATGKKCPLS